MQGIRLEGENFDTRVSNSIWAFTPGTILKDGWLSDKAQNQEMLYRKGDTFDYTLKHSKNKMMIAVPRWVRNLVYKKGSSMETFWIKFFDANNGDVYPTPTKTIVFRKVMILENVPRNFDKVPNGAQASYQEITLEIKNGVEYPE